MNLPEWLLNGGPLLMVYLVANVIVMAMYGIDKYKAIHKQWRIPEVTLLTAAVIGVFGALAGMYVFRHKTKKPKFFITVPLILVLELALLLFG